MAVYMCGYCDELKDDDYNPCSDWFGDLICEDCATELSCEECGVLVKEEDELTHGDHLCNKCAYEANKELEEYKADCEHDRRRDDRLTGEE